MVAQASVDAIANNLANVSTGGFKKAVTQVESTTSMLLYRIQTDPGQVPGQATPGQPAIVPVGQLGFGSYVYDTPTVFEQGALQATGNPLNVALTGPGFLTIQTPQGVRYTRQGDLVVNPQGQLTTTNGNPVLGNAGPITIPNNATVSFSSTGQVVVNNVPADQLRLTEFANLNNLRPEGNSRFVNEGAGPAPATATTVNGGFLETSTANVVSSMVDLINNERWFDANTKVIQSEDTELGTAINTIGAGK